MSKISELQVTYTTRGLPRYMLEVRHEELNKYQVIRGDNSDIVRQKARVKAAQWDEMWRRQLEHQQKARDIAGKKNLAEERTLEAEKTLEALERVLAHTLAVDDTVDWESLKNYDGYSIPKPERPEPPPKPHPPEIPQEPQLSDPQYVVQAGVLDKLVSSRRASKEAAAKTRFSHDHDEWQKTKGRLEAQYQAQVKEYERRVREQEAEFEAALAKWEPENEEYLRSRDKSNAAVDMKKETYAQGEPGAVLDYCDIVLSNSEYPDYFPQSYDLDYNPENKILIVDYQLPSLDSMPTLKEVQYVQARDEFTEKHISQAQLNRLYDKLLYQITLRTIHELYEADTIDALASIVFNGYVRSIDPAIGQETNACVVSVQTIKDEFERINLANVDPKTCFKRLKGVGSSRLHSRTPIAPVMRIEREDKRFVSAYAVADDLTEEDNLAIMDWEDFEHLVRELFEKEFASSGGEVKVTRASRDGGIDAVAFDPDPIRGGKIVIQAKRYVHTVGVSAVRDLYGTVMNEGANKGILVTTADYGPDAYEFVKGKPLVLISGSNLLHLLRKHGYKAKIDLKEARKIIAEEGKG